MNLTMHAFLVPEPFQKKLALMLITNDYCEYRKFDMKYVLCPQNYLNAVVPTGVHWYVFLSVLYELHYFLQTH